MLDPLRCLEPLPLRHVSYPLGHALEILTNSQDVVDAANNNWGSFRQQFPEEPMRLSIIVSGEESSELPPAPVFRARGHLMSIVCDTSNFAVVDLESGFAFCWLSPFAASQTDWVRRCFLDGMVYCMLVCRRYTPLHAACVSKDGRGVILCGVSGAGKSSLAFACALQGWKFLTDDVVYLKRGLQEPIAFGKPTFIRFVPSAKSLFPALRHLPEVPGPDGEWMLELETSSSNLVQTSEKASIAAVVFLDRVEGAPAAVHAISPDEANQLLLSEIPTFGDEVYARFQESLAILIRQAQVMRITYWDMDAAVDLLSAIIRG